MKNRCSWVGEDELMAAYHDEEWGVPVFEDQKLFEFLVLEGAQAGLSWQTILNKREGYRKNFANFDPKKVAKFDDKRIAKILTDPGIVRNRLKVSGVVKNARAFLEVQKEYGSFATYVWGFVDNKPIDGKRKHMKDVPAVTPQAEALSKELKKRGFTFVGPTIMYAFMQAVGMVNDHTNECFRYSNHTK